MIVATVALLFTVPAAISVQTVENHNRVFEVDYAHDRFLKDGEPFRYISGSLQYFRVPRALWLDRIRKYKAAGLNAICTYVEWRIHEPIPGKYDFEGENDVEAFINMIHSEGMLVILRPGPYICAERDFGGYPPWLLHENPKMGLRTREPSHVTYVHSWLSVLLPRIQPLLYGNGGPIIMVQVENEYGSYYACDHVYTRWLRDVFRLYIGSQAVLFTTDGNGAGYLKCGPIPGVLATVDFGPENNVSEAFQPLRDFQPHGPLVNSEFYPGWLTHWGEPGSATVPTDKIINATRQLLKIGASFNFYVFHGGTNFGFSSGVNNPPFAPQITSYDYNAPISECGNLTEKYYAIRSVISEFHSVPNLGPVGPGPVNYGTVKLEYKVSLFNSGTGKNYGQFLYPKTFEFLEQYSGLMLYETALPHYGDLAYIVAEDVHDRTYVFVDQEPAGIFSRTNQTFSIILGKGKRTLSLLVENQGHINFGKFLDLKGLVKNVTLNGQILKQWKQTGYPLTNVDRIPSLPSVKDGDLPAFYVGHFNIPQADSYQDTFLDMSGWGKGVAYINGFNLGRYWPTEGPQITLYLPGTLLQQRNTLVLLELEHSHCDDTVGLVDKPILHEMQGQSFENLGDREPVVIKLGRR